MQPKVDWFSVSLGNSFIQSLLAQRPRGKSIASAPGENRIAPLDPKLRLQDFYDRGSHRHLMRTTIFAARGRQTNHTALEVDFAPAQPTDLVSSLCREHKKLDDSAKPIVGKASQNNGKLVIGQHRVACGLGSLVCIC